jgi:hypothetical protein
VPWTSYVATGYHHVCNFDIQEEAAFEFQILKNRAHLPNNFLLLLSAQPHELAVELDLGFCVHLLVPHLPRHIEQHVMLELALFKPVITCD